MIRPYTFCLAVLAYTATLAQAPGDDLIWMKSSEGNALQVPLVNTDKDCDMVVAARYYNPSTWYAEYEGTMLYSDVDSTWDQVLLKLDSAGNLLWHKRIYGNGVDVMGLTHDADKNVIVGLGAFEPMTVDGQLTSSRFTVLKIDPAGNLLWHTDLDGCLIPPPLQRKVSVDPLGRIVFASTVDEANAIIPFPLSVNGTVYPTPTDFQGFILCWLNPVTGAVDQFMQYATPAVNHRLRVASIDATTGDIFLTGDTDDNTPYLVVDGDTLDGTPGYHNRQCLLRFDEDGTLLWGRTYFGHATNAVFAWELEVAPGGGSVLLSANYYLSAEYNGTVLNSAGLQDVLLMKVDAVGDLQWARSAGSPNTNNVGHVTISPTGRTVLSGLGNMDLRMLQYDAAGTLEWTLPYEGNGNQMGGNAAFTGCDELMHVGVFNNRMDVGPHSFWSIPWNLRDMYILKFAAKDGNVATGLGAVPDDLIRTWLDPNDGSLHFVLPQDHRVQRLVICDAMGKEVWSSAVRSSTFTLDHSSLGAGVYIYRLLDGAGSPQGSGRWVNH